MCAATMRPPSVVVLFGCEQTMRAPILAGMDRAQCGKSTFPRGAAPKDVFCDMERRRWVKGRGTSGTPPLIPPSLYLLSPSYTPPSPRLLSALLLLGPSPAAAATNVTVTEVKFTTTFTNTTAISVRRRGWGLVSAGEKGEYFYWLRSCI